MIDKLQTDLKQAQLDKNEAVVSTLRMLLSEIQYEKGKTGEDLSDEKIIGVIQKEVKKRKEASASFVQGNRSDLAEKEESEAEILQNYLPTQLSDDELTAIVKAAVTESGANSLQDMGRVIGLVMKKVGQSADGGRVSNMVKNELSSN